MDADSHTAAPGLEYRTGVSVVPLTLNQQQWQEEFGLGVLVRWGLAEVFIYGVGSS